MSGINASNSGATLKRSGEIGMIAAIAKWCECLQGRTPLSDGLELLASSLGIEAIALTRSSRDDAGEYNSIFFDLEKGTERSPRLERSFARAVLGPYFRQPRAGSVWFKTLTETEIDPRLESFHLRRRLTELAVIPLSVEDKTAMFLELHFASYHGGPQHALINMTAPTLAGTWSRRKPGLMTEEVLNRRPPRRMTKIMAPILSAENPAGLSRAEFRVCLLLSRGQSNKRACKELAISESTLRTHLRSIYAKTDSGCQSELLYELLSSAQVPATPSSGISGAA